MLNMHYKKLTVFYVLIICFLFLSIAKAGHIFTNDYTDEEDYSDDDHGHQFNQVKKRDVSIYFGNEAVQGNNGNHSLFNLNNLNDSLSNAMDVIDRHISNISFNRVNNQNELSVMEDALTYLFQHNKLHLDIDINADGVLKIGAETFINRINNNLLEIQENENIEKINNEKEDRRDNGDSDVSDDD